MSTPQPVDPSTIPTLAPAPSLLAGVNVLLEGPTGTGKTYSIGTLVDCGVETFYLALESGLESLIGYWTDRGLEVPANLHWNFLDMHTGGLKALTDSAKTVGDLPQDGLYKLQDMTRSQRNYFLKILTVCNNFQDQRTGKSFGATDTWGPDKALVVDGLSGLGEAAFSMVIGTKPVKSQTDWGVAQDHVEKFINLCCNGCKCHFVLLSHIEREVDQISLGTRVMVSTLGKALPPKIPPKFSDVILTMRTGKIWSWSTANTQTDLKTRNLEIADGLPPDFSKILEKWKSRGGKLSPTVKF